MKNHPTLETTNWTSVTTTVLNHGSLKWVVVPANTGNKLYRLRK